jgi:REP element-mobilizing transposase RayT
VRKADVEVWAYCLMPNDVHLILNPRQPDGLGAVGMFGGTGGICVSPQPLTTLH